MKVGDRVMDNDPPAGWGEIVGTIRYIDFHKAAVEWENGEVVWEKLTRLRLTSDCERLCGAPGCASWGCLG